MGEPLPPTQVVALGYSIVGSISDKAQITFHHAIAEDESDADVNAKLDRIMGFIDRQVSKYEAPGLRKELADLEDKLMLVDGDMATSEANYQKAQADIDVQVETYQSEIKRINNVGYERHRTSGRGGSYTPRGTDAQAIAASEAGLQKAAQMKANNEAERGLFLSNIDTNKQRMAARVEFLKGKLAEIDKLVT